MQYSSDFSYDVEVKENSWIEMSDGVRLAARLWLPAGSSQKPVPAVLEYIPYRKRDTTRIRDEKIHGYFAGHGYASVRVDIRGSGDSEGVLCDEYLEQELVDGEEVIEWIAKQPWCNGDVGMIGISWGGFNGLQIAARQPKALKTIITICSTDDRYADDVHYMGGCLLGDNLSWASVMLSKNSLPPDPLIVGDAWRKMWFQRLEGSGLWLKNWLEHQRRDAFWKHGSICENYDDIQIPVMTVSGWADGYTNAVFRMLNNLRVPTMGLVGPWSHRYPQEGQPGPAVGFLDQALRWWERWLKGTQNGIDEEPMLKAWVQKSVAPSSSYIERPGYWLGLNNWPSDAIQNETFQLSGDQRLDRDPKPSSIADAQEELWVSSPLQLGMFGGKWCSYSAPPDLPTDQREEDGGALVFETEPLEEVLEIVGAPVAEFSVSSDKPVAMLAVRLSDLRSDGKATRVTYGLLNLTPREGSEQPSELEPGTFYHVKVQLNDIAHRFPKSHRIRLSVSNVYFPLAWPTPELSTLRLRTADSRLHLPIKVREGDQQVQFGEPESAVPPTQKTILHQAGQKWQVVRDLIYDGSTLEVVQDRGTYALDSIDLKVSDRREERYFVGSDSPDSARGETEACKVLQRKGWRVETRTKTVLTSDRDYFYIHAQLDAFEDDERVFSKNWTERIKRDHI